MWVIPHLSLSAPGSMSESALGSALRSLARVGLRYSSKRLLCACLQERRCVCAIVFGSLLIVRSAMRCKGCVCLRVQDQGERLCLVFDRLVWPASAVVLLCMCALSEPCVRGGGVGGGCAMFWWCCALFGKGVRARTVVVGCWMCEQDEWTSPRCPHVSALYATAQLLIIIIILCIRYVYIHILNFIYEIIRL